jgi:hypothetical protein
MEDRISTVTTVKHEATNGAGKVTVKVNATIEVFDLSQSSASAQLLGITQGFTAPAQAQVKVDQ